MESLKDLVAGVLTELQTPEKTVRQKLIQQWASIAGPKIAQHTRPSLAKDGRLFVWVEQSALAYELSQRYRQTFLKRVQAALGEDVVKAISFRVGELR